MLLDELVKLCTQLLREGRSADAVTACDNALAETLSRPAKVRVLELKAQALVAADGRWRGPAIGCLQDALDLTKPGSEERGRVLCAFTAAYAGLASHVLCRQYRNAFLELFNSTKDPGLAKYYPAVNYNLALAYHEVDDLEEAEEAYLIVLAQVQRSNDPYVREKLPYIQHNLVDVYQEMDRHHEAWLMMEAAYSTLPDDVFGAQMRDRRAIYALDKGDLQAAVLWVESGLGHPACDPKTRAALMLTKAKIEHAHGQEAAAHDLALEAMQLASQAHSNRLCERISRFMNRMSKGV
ncbi:MAG TPA: tetratricopeptide repeat protein [Symbiobacteriaceae bacterium]